MEYVILVPSLPQFKLSGPFLHEYASINVLADDSRGGAKGGTERKLYFCQSANRVIDVRIQEIHISMMNNVQREQSCDM
jgi:hypothetical protein